MKTCPGKTRFASRNEAMRAATSIARPNGDRRMRAYWCNSCKCWHIAKVGRSS